MMTKIVRFGPTIGIAGLVFFIAGVALAQEKTSFPAFTGKRVYVEGVPDQFEGLGEQIARLERSSPQTYYVVVVRSSGIGSSPTKDYVEDLYQTWRKQASGRGLSLDPERSVIVVMALDNKQLAVLPGKTLRDQFGLRQATVERELITKPVIDLAKDRKYTEAISTLLNSTQNWIAAKDRLTAKVSNQIVTASAPAPAATRSDRSETRAISLQPVPAAKESFDLAAVILGILGILLAAIPIAFLVWRWNQHRSTRNRLTGRIKETRAKAVEVMDRLDGLKDRLKLLPTSADFQEPMAGETLAYYKTVEQKVSTLWDGWLQIMETLDKAQKLEAKAGGSPLSTKMLNDVEEMINKQGTFEEIEVRAAASGTELDGLTQSHQAVKEALAAVTTARPKIEAGLAAAKKVDLPTKPYEEELGAVDAATTQCRTQAAGDPMGAKTALEPLRSRVEGLLTRIERVVSLFREAQQAKTALEQLARQVAGFRSQGLKLVEEGGNPDGPLRDGVDAHAETLTALRDGEPDTAAQKLEVAQAKLQEARTTLESVQKARSLCEREQTGRPRETQRMREALPQAESYQADLEREFASESWQPVAKNLEQARALLATFDRQAKDAAAAAATQRYLAGAQGYDQLAQQQRIVLRLMSGLSEQLNSLISVRTECRKLGDALATRERQVDLYLRQNESIIGDVARTSLESAIKAYADIVARSNQGRPDWPSLRQSLAEVTEEYAIAQSQAEDDVRHHQELTTEFDKVRQTASRVYALLAGHTEDRLAANQHYQAAADTLDRIGVQIDEPRGLSARMLEEVRGAAQDLERSEQLALEDLRLAAQATSEINEASRSIHQSGGYSAMGYGTDTSHAQSQLAQAQESMQTQNYEQAIQLAGGAIQSAKQAYYAAMQQALTRQVMVSADERRESARSSAPAYNGVSFGAAAAAAAAAVILGQATSASASTSNSESTPDSEVGVGSWEGDAGQGNW